MNGPSRTTESLVMTQYKCAYTMLVHLYNTYYIAYPGENTWITYELMSPDGTFFAWLGHQCWLRDGSFHYLSFLTISYTFP